MNGKRILAWLLTLALTVGLLQISVFAAEEPTAPAEAEAITEENGPDIDQDMGFEVLSEDPEDTFTIEEEFGFAEVAGAEEAGEVPEERRLASLVVRAGSAATTAEYALEPAFDPQQKEYSFYLPDYLTSAYVGAALAETASGKTITLEYKNPSDGSDITKTISDGGTVAGSLAKASSLTGQDVTVKVDGEEAYLLHVRRQASLASQAGLTMKNGEETIALTPVYNRSVYEYELMIRNQDILTVKAKPTASSASLQIDGKAAQAETEVSVTPVWQNRKYDLVISVSGEDAKAGEYVIHLYEMPLKLEITKAPDKTVYEAGERFDPAGMELTATYADGEAVIIPAGDCTFAPEGALGFGDRTVTVSYNGVSAEQQIGFISLFEGSGTEEDPFLIATAQDMQTLDDYVEGGETFAGTYLKVTGDIALANGWNGIGTNGGSTGLQAATEDSKPFSGDFDGGGYTITIPNGGRAVFDFVRTAKIHDLNVYGEKIADYGLISSYIDQGQYVTSVAEIDRVTLKAGTQTLYSGFLGGYASGANKVAIRNCTIEEGCVIGYDRKQSNIGGFTGEISGTIENSTCSAAIYGVNYVGGIAANKGQSMSPFTIEGCAFDGVIEATGSYVGGITGAGYGGTKWGMASAWSTRGVTINNCTSSGTIRGDKGVGGIFGGDGAQAQAWDNGPTYIRGNTFTGTVSGNEYVGAVIGYMIGLNRNSYIENNFYVSGCGAAEGIGAVGGIDTSGHEEGTIDGVYYYNTSTAGEKTAAEIRSEVPGHELVNYIEIPGTSDQKTLASSGYGSQFKVDLNRTDDPLDADKEFLCSDDLYAVVDKALETVPEDLSIYTDATRKAVEDAVAAVDRTETSLEKVNAMAKAIKDAVAGLKEKKAQTLTVKASAKSVGYDTLASGAKTYSLLTVSGAKGTLSYKKTSGSGYVTVNSKTGKLTVKKNTPAGKQTVKIKVSAAATGTYLAGSKSVSVTITVNKASQPMTAKANAKTVSLSKLSKANQTVKGAVTVKKAQGTVTYKKTKGNSKITINSKNGKITVKKGLKKGKYTVTVQVKAAGNKNYKAGTKTVKVTITVK